jgi:hypothetical protein
MHSGLKHYVLYTTTIGTAGEIALYTLYSCTMHYTLSL